MVTSYYSQLKLCTMQEHSIFSLIYAFLKRLYLVYGTFKIYDRKAEMVIAFCQSNKKKKKKKSPRRGSGSPWNHTKQQISGTKVLWKHPSVQSTLTLTSVTAVAVLTTSCPFSTTAPAVLKGQQPARLSSPGWLMTQIPPKRHVQWTKKVFRMLYEKYTGRK